METCGVPISTERSHRGVERETRRDMCRHVSITGVDELEVAQVTAARQERGQQTRERYKEND